MVTLKALSASGANRATLGAAAMRRVPKALGGAALAKSDARRLVHRVLLNDVHAPPATTAKAEDVKRVDTAQYIHAIRRDVLTVICDRIEMGDAKTAARMRAKYQL